VCVLWGGKGFWAGGEGGGEGEGVERMRLSVKPVQAKGLDG